MDPILVIMAAGIGSRYGGNKQLDAVTPNGDIIMDFSLYDAYRAGFRRVIFIIREEFKGSFEAHMSNKINNYFDIEYAYQNINDIPEGYKVPAGRQKPWGTAHAVLSAKNLIDSPFAVINADDFYGANAFKQIFDFLKYKATDTHHAMVSFKIENTLSKNGTVTRGICTASNGILESVEEHFEISMKKNKNGDSYISAVNSDNKAIEIKCGTPVSMNLWGFGKEFVTVMDDLFKNEFGNIIKNNPIKGEFYLPYCISKEIHDNKASVSVLSSDDQWFGVTYRKDKIEVEKAIQSMINDKKYPDILWK